MQFIDLKTQHQRIAKEVQMAIEKVFAHGQFIMGPELAELDQALAQYLGVKHSIALANGTVALQVAMMALDIKPGDEIITTPFSFFATSETIALLGAKPIYVDIHPHTYNINASLIEAAITEKTRAIIPVSLYGQVADMDEINAIAKKHGLFVIEDAAQSFGASYKGKKSGNLSTIACTSFFPAKPLGAYGDAGACFTNDDELARKMRSIINHGQTERYSHTMLGMNGRCDTLQAAILLEKLKIFDDELAKRQQVAAWYFEKLRGIAVTPEIEPHNFSAFAQFTVRIPKSREKVQAFMQAKDIPTTVHYPLGLHEQPIGRVLFDTSQAFPETEKAAKEVLSLPFHPYMKEQDVENVVEVLKSALL